MIDAVDPDYLVACIKQAPSLRGMILGYVAELMFERHIPESYTMISAEHIRFHDDHNRKENKSDRTIAYKGREYGIPLKSIQTNSIARNLDSGLLEGDVQNDASDRREIILGDGSLVNTTCYLRGEYDILAVPLFPFTGDWTFAYKRNEDCATSQHAKYTPFQQNALLATVERICWPLSAVWRTNLIDLLTPNSGSPIGRPDVLSEPGGEVRVRESAATILPQKD